MQTEYLSSKYFEPLLNLRTEDDVGVNPLVNYY